VSGSYLATPGGGDPHGGVVVCMEMFGVTAYVRDAARRRDDRRLLRRLADRDRDRAEPARADAALTAGIAAPLLFLVGDADHAVPAADRERIAGALSAGGVQHELVVYRDTPHGFFCDVRDTYRPAQAADAWARARRALASAL
jgi:dienelactone hydrolase